MERIARIVTAFQDDAFLETDTPFWDGFRVGFSAPASLFAWTPLNAPSLSGSSLAQVWSDVGDSLKDGIELYKSDAE